MRSCCAGRRHLSLEAPGTNSKSGDAVLMSAADFDSWQETIYLLRSPANAQRVMEAVAGDKSGLAAVVKTMEELEALAGE
ncbi:MAG: type II toxin-antitoxin system prevent-host-death family antitoxin [Streptosporangiaceae bacterium]